MRNIPRSEFRTPRFEGSQGVISSARRFAKAEVRGAIPRKSTIPTRNAKLEARNIWHSFDLVNSAFCVPRFLRPCASAATGAVL